MTELMMSLKHTNRPASSRPTVKFQHLHSQVCVAVHMHSYSITIMTKC